MSISEFQKIIRQMSPEQLLRAQQMLQALIDDGGRATSGEAPTGKERRQHQRFDVNLRGTLRPLAPGRRQPGERTLPITILDVSREGLRFVVDTTEALYPIGEITFTAPNGRLRSLFVRLVRTRLIQTSSGKGDSRQATEVATRAIDAADLAEAQQRHRELVAATKRIPSPELLPIVLVGEEGARRKKYEALLGGKGHPLHVAREPESVMAMLESSGPQVVVYANGGTVLMHGPVVEEIRKSRSETAQIAVITSTEDRRPLLTAGMDECVHDVNAKALLEMYIDRAVKARLISSVPCGMKRQTVLVHAAENLSLAQLGSRLGPDQFQVAFAHDIDGLLARLRCTDVDVVLVDHAPASADDWRLIRTVRQEIRNLPMIVAVSDPRLGSDAILAGAADYLTMPFTVRNITQLINASLQAAECQKAVDAAGPPNFDAA